MYIVPALFMLTVFHVTILKYIVECLMIVAVITSMI